MEQIKKKMAALKQEKEDAVERADDLEQQKKEAEQKVDAVRYLKVVRCVVCMRPLGYRLDCRWTLYLYLLISPVLLHDIYCLNNSFTINPDN